MLLTTTFLDLKNIYGTVGLVTPLLLPVSWVTLGFRHWMCQVLIVSIHYKSDSHYSFFLQWKAVNNKMFLTNPISTAENFSPSLLEDVINLKLQVYCFASSFLSYFLWALICEVPMFSTTFRARWAHTVIALQVYGL